MAVQNSNASPQMPILFPVFGGCTVTILHGLTYPKILCGAAPKARPSNLTTADAVYKGLSGGLAFEDRKGRVLNWVQHHGQRAQGELHHRLRREETSPGHHHRGDPELRHSKGINFCKSVTSISSHVCGNPIRNFNLKHDVFLTMWFLCLNLTRPLKQLSQQNNSNLT